MKRALFLSVSVLFVALVASADDGPVLHEYVPDLAADEGTLLVSSGGSTPDAIVYQGELLPAPEPGGLRDGEQAMRAGASRGEQPGRRATSFRPDRQTELNGTVGYYAVFRPTIAPFKRVTGLDAVTLAADGTPVLTIADPRRRPVEVVGANASPPDDRPRDRFWGSVVLDFAEGDTVPFPAVSPESRVLTLQTDPVTQIRLERDGADNLYATRAGTPRMVRVIFLMDAPRSYFGRAIPAGPVGAHADGFPALPASVQRDALELAAELGLSTRSSFEDALSALTRHFRSFVESSEPPRDTGNIFLDLSRGMRGICRHRAYGFVIAAQALGMHARFVQNEAHAWVEVQLPEGGWMRVDLGGAATGLEARMPEGDPPPPYEPRTPDPLPRPPAYEAAYEEAQRMSGVRAPRDDAEEGDAVSVGADGADGALEGGAPGAAEGAAPGGSERGGGASGGLTVSLDGGQREVFRGRELEVTGAVRGGSEGVEGLRVEVLLQAPRAHAERLLGVTVTRAHGRFRGVFGVPPDLAVGEYRLLVRTPGNDRFGPAVAR